MFPVFSRYWLLLCYPPNGQLVIYLIMYSFLYWPTYVIGIVLIALSVAKIRKKR